MRQSLPSRTGGAWVLSEVPPLSDARALLGVMWAEADSERSDWTAGAVGDLVKIRRRSRP
jgi:hypothetical protein